MVPEDFSDLFFFKISFMFTFFSSSFFHLKKFPLIYFYLAANVHKELIPTSVHLSCKCLVFVMDQRTRISQKHLEFWY